MKKIFTLLLAAAIAAPMISADEVTVSLYISEGANENIKIGMYLGSMQNDVTFDETTGTYNVTNFLGYENGNINFSLMTENTFMSSAGEKKIPLGFNIPVGSSVKSNNPQYKTLWGFNVDNTLSGMFSGNSAVTDLRLDDLTMYGVCDETAMGSFENIKKRSFAILTDDGYKFFVQLSPTDYYFKTDNGYSYVYYDDDLAYDLGLGEYCLAVFTCSTGSAPVPEPSYNFTYSGSDNDFSIHRNDSATLTLSLDNADLAYGFQTDITLPAGLSIAEKAGKLDVYFGDNTAAASHALSASKVKGDNTYRIIAYSDKNDTFKSGKDLLNINIVSDNTLIGGDITIDNTVISIADSDEGYTPDVLTIKVPEFVGVGQITLDPTAASLNLGETLTISAEVSPANAWVKTVTWSSSNESVATVSKDGVVTSVAKGTAVITATSTDGTEISATATITVTNYMQTLSIGEDVTLEVEESMQLTPVFTPTTADDTELTWSSSDPAVAYVGAKNELHALAVGTATITATNAASGLKATITVTVEPILFGDANNNGIVAIDDVVTDVQYILEQNPTPFNFKRADVNRDNKINILDVSKTVAIILSNTPANAPHRAPAYALSTGIDGLVADDVTLTANDKTMTISLGNVENITAIQGDIELPEDVTIAGISVSGSQQGDHRVSFAYINDNRVRFILYSLSLDRMNVNQPMLKIDFECSKEFENRNIEVYDIMASDVHSDLVSFNSLSVNISNTNTTGIEDQLSDNAQVGDIYTIQGICVMRDATQNDINALAPGLYIVRQGSDVKKIAIN